MFPKMKKLEKKTYEVRKNIVYCVHIEIENAVRCTRKEQWSRNEFCWLRCFFSAPCSEKRIRKKRHSICFSDHEKEYVRWHVQ